MNYWILKEKLSLWEISGDFGVGCGQGPTDWGPTWNRENHWWQRFRWPKFTYFRIVLIENKFISHKFWLIFYDFFVKKLLKEMNIGPLNVPHRGNAGHQQSQNTMDGKILMSNFLHVTLKVVFASVNRAIWTQTMTDTMAVRPRTISNS